MVETKYRPRRPHPITSLPPRRRPPSPHVRRRVAAGLFAAALVALLVFTAGIWAGRATVPEPPAPSKAAALGPPSAGAGAGPAAGVPGLRVGWPRTRAGAAGAATAYLVAASGRAYTTDPRAREEVLRATALPEQLPAALAAARAAVEPAPGSPAAAAQAGPSASAWRYVPVGYRVDRYTPDGRW